MAWANRGRLSGKVVKSLNRRWHALRPENPFGISKAVMKALAGERLPLNKEAYERRLKQLIATIESNGRK